MNDHVIEHLDNGGPDMAMITCDMIISRETITDDTNLNFKLEIGNIKHDQVPLELI